jgi:hypothetical protein
LLLAQKDLKPLQSEHLLAYVHRGRFNSQSEILCRKGNPLRHWLNRSVLEVETDELGLLLKSGSRLTAKDAIKGTTPTQE